jgi:hypothetical protein
MMNDMDTLKRAILNGDWLGYGLCQSICGGLCGWGSWKCTHPRWGT